jgi:Flp pilus assembly protein TadB
MTVLAIVAAVALVFASLPRTSASRLPRLARQDAAEAAAESGQGLPVPQQRTNRRDLASSLPDIAELLALCLQAGADLPGALQVSADSAPGPARTALRQAAALMELGVSPVQAFAQWDGVADPLIRAFERSQRTGSALAEECARVAVDLRAEDFGRIQQRARSVGVRAVFPLMGCFLPAFVLLGVVPVVAALALSLFASN